jgi:hypothetical protein
LKRDVIQSVAVSLTPRSVEVSEAKGRAPRDCSQLFVSRLRTAIRIDRSAVRRSSLTRKRDPVTGILADNQLEPDPSPPRLKMLRKQHGWPHLIIAASDRDNLGLGPFHGNAGLSYTVSKRD